MPFPSTSTTPAENQRLVNSHLKNNNLIMTMLRRNKENIISRLTTVVDCEMINEGKRERGNKLQRNHGTPTIQKGSSNYGCRSNEQYSHNNSHDMSHSNKQYHHRCLVGVIRVLWLTLLLWCEPKAVAHGLPLPFETLATENDVVLVPLMNYGAVDGGRFFSEGMILPGEELSSVETNTQEQEQDQEEGENEEDVQEETGSHRTSGGGLLETFTSPRSKKGLSYLSKYYSTAILNNINLNGGNASSKSVSHNANQFFGVGGGRPSSSTRNSSEQKFPTIRRKLSFYPPMTSHSTFITPWSRFVARPTTMRLRWGK